MICACCEQIVWMLLVDDCRGWCWCGCRAGCAGRDSHCVVLHCDMCYLVLCGITLWYVHVVNKLCGCCWLMIAEDAAGVIVGLAVLAVILIAVAIILGVIVWR